MLYFRTLEALLALALMEVPDCLPPNRNTSVTFHSSRHYSTGEKCERRTC